MLKQFIDRVWSGGTSTHDSEIYALVYKELSAGQMDPGLWTKATAVSDGNIEKAKSRYIEMRANSLRAERNKLMGFARQVQREQLRVERERLRVERESVEQRRRSVEVQKLKAEESVLVSQLWERFDSPDAKMAKRKRYVVSTSIYMGACVLLYATLSDYNLLAVLMLAGLFIWLLSVATYGRLELDDRLSKVRKQIVKLGE